MSASHRSRARKVRNRSRRSPGPRRLFLEQLEDRFLLSGTDPMPGRLVSSFGNEGLVISSFSADDVATATVVDRDNRILVAGTSTDATDRDFFVARYLEDGSLDPAFGVNGSLLIDFGGSDEANGLTLDRQGRIVVAGRTIAGGVSSIAVARLTSDGQLDETFSDDGIAVPRLLPTANGGEAAYGVAIQSNGGIILGGYATVTTYVFPNFITDVEFAVARLTDAGEKDPTFGEDRNHDSIQDGFTLTTVGQADPLSGAASFDIARSVAVRSSDDAIVLAGDVFTNELGTRPALVLYNADGLFENLDVRDEVQGQSFGVTFDKQGKIVAAGQYSNLFGSLFYTRSGAFETFYADEAFPGVARAVVIQENGKILLGGSQNVFTDDVFITRLDVTRRPDETFADSGTAFLPIGASGEASAANSIALTSNGTIIVTGRATTNSGVNRVLTLQLEGDPNRLERHTQLEWFAKDRVYRDNWNLGEDVMFGYTVDAIWDNPVSGFFAFGLTAPDQPPVLVFRGTEPVTVVDVLADLAPEGIGYNQFQIGLTLASPTRDSSAGDPRLSITDWLDTFLSSGQLPVITGHSLGGALAQWFTAGYVTAGGELAETVTFNSPGIRRQEAESFAPYADMIPVTHYVMQGDFVSMGGDEFLKGSVYFASFHTGSILASLAIADKHLKPILADGVLGSLRPDGLIVSEGQSTEWINEPFFIYADADYARMITELTVAAGIGGTIIGDPDLANIPLSLLFRSTAENSRVILGTVLKPLIDTVTAVAANPGDRFELPDIDIHLAGLIGFETHGLSLEYVGSDRPYLRFTGNGRINVLGYGDLQADFSGANGLIVSSTGIVGQADLALYHIPIIPAQLEIHEATLRINADPPHREISGTASVTIPPGIDVDGTFEFNGNRLEAVSLTVGTAIPIPFPEPPVFYITQLGMSVGDLTHPDPFPEIGGTITVSVGPNERVPLPRWLGGSVSTDILSLTGTATIAPDHLTGQVGLNILNGWITSADQTYLQEEWNWKQGTIQVSGQIQVPGPLGFTATADASLLVDGNLNLTGKGTASFRLPETIGRIKLPQTSKDGAFYVQYRHNSVLYDDYIIVFESSSVGDKVDLNWGVRLSLDGRSGIPAIKDIESILSPQPQNDVILTSTSGNLNAILENDEITPAPIAGQFSVGSDSTVLLMVADWVNDIGHVPVEVIDPNGTVFDEAAITASEHIEVLTALGGPTTKVIGVANPMSGIWTLRVNPAEDPGEVAFEGYASDSPPTIQIDDIEVAGSQVIVSYSAADPDSDAVVSFFVDSDGSGEDGIYVGEGVEVDGQATFTFDMSSFEAGQYFVYAIIADANSIPLTVYGTLPFNVEPLANEQPVAASQTVTTSQGRQVAIQLSGDDGDPGIDQQLTYHVDLNHLPQYGQLLGYDNVTGEVRASLVYKPGAEFRGYDRFSFTVTDDRGLSSASALVTIDVRSINRPPVVTVPETLAMGANSSLTFLAEHGNAITISDPDAYGDAVEVILSAEPGSFRLATTQGLTLVEGDGTGHIIFQGSLADVNAAVSGLSYSPPLGYEGQAVITVSANDLGHRGFPGELTDTESFTVTVVPPASGALDLGFGDSGILVDGVSYGEALAIQPDGKLVISGHKNFSYTEFGSAIIRLMPNGERDLSFGDGGAFITSLLVHARAIQIQPDGRIIVGGTHQIDSVSADFGLIRLNADGSLDTTFGDGGLVVTDLSAQNDHIEDLRLESDGRILAIGNSGTVGQSASMARYVSDGSVDLTFGSNGIRVTAAVPITNFYSHQFLPDGRYLYANAGTIFAIDADGTVATGFGNNDHYLHDSRYYFSAIAVDPSGYLYFGGTERNSPFNQPAAVVGRFDLNGQIDTTFGVDGIATVSSPVAFEAWSADRIVVLPDGSLITIGDVVATNNGINGGFVLAKFRSDGTLDPSFGIEGTVRTQNEDNRFGSSHTGLKGMLFWHDTAVALHLHGTDLDYEFGAFDLIRYVVHGNTAPVAQEALEITAFSHDANSLLDLPSYFGDLEQPTRTLFYSIVANTDSSLFDGLAIDDQQTLVLDYNPDAKGTADITVRATDAGGLFADLVIHVTVNNAIPVTTGLPNVTVLEDALPTVLSLFPAFGDVTDTDSELSYSIVGITNTEPFSAVLIDPSTGWLTLNYAADANGEADVNVRATDTVGQFVETTFRVNVVAVNDAPRIVLPNPLSTDAGVAVSFVTASGNAIAITDDGSDAALYAVTLAVDVGSLTLGSTSGLSFTIGDGTADQTMTFQATLSDTNAALDGTVFVAEACGTVVLTITIQDGGSEGIGDEQVASAQLPIAVGQYTGPGTPDPTLGGGQGFVTTALTSRNDAVFGIVVQTDGKVVVAGRSDRGSSIDLALVRYNANGSLDPTFGTGGIVTTPVRAGDDTIRNITLDALGRIVVVGHGSSSAGEDDWDIVVVRYNADGSLDTTFSGDGKVVTKARDERDLARSVLVQPDGKILVIGGSEDSANNSTMDFAILRYNDDGTLDTSWSGDGKAYISFALPGSDNGYDLVLQPDGKVVVTGYVDTVAGGEVVDWRWAIARLNSNGTLDTSFGNGGKITPNFNSSDEKSYTVTLDSSGRILVGGYATFEGRTTFAVARFNANGSFDTSFGSGGKLIDLIGTGNARVTDLLLQPDGKILASGSAVFEGTRRQVLARYLPHGVRDTSFGSDGLAVGTLSSVFDETPAALLPDGRIIVGVSPNGTTNYDFGWARYLGDTPVAAPLTLVEDGPDHLLALRDVFGDHSATESLLAYSVRYISNPKIFSAVVLDPNNGTLTLNPAPDAWGTTTLVVSAMSAGGLCSEVTFDVTVLPVNDSPVVILPATQTTAEETPLLLSTAIGNAIRLTDVDAGAETVQVTLTAAHGTLTIPPAALVSFVAETTNAQSSISLQGSLRALNAALDGITYLPDVDFEGIDSVTVQLTDLGFTGGGALSDNQSLNVIVTGVNDAPRVHLPNSQITDNDLTLVFSTAAGNAVHVEDVDAGTGAIQVTLKANGGTLSLATLENVTLVNGTGGGDTSVSIEGTLSAINAALDGMLYTAANCGWGTLTVAVNDLGQSGEGGHLMDQKVLFVAASPTVGARLDPTFGSSGILKLMPDENSQVYSVAEQSDGKIIVAIGVVTSNYLTGHALVRLNADGSLDTSFGEGGIVDDLEMNRIASVLVLENDDIVVGGDVNSTGLYGQAVQRPAIVRLHSNGSLDTSFGIDGVATIPTAGNGTLYHFLVTADGRILTGGIQSQNVGNYGIPFYRFDYWLSRLLPTGELDQSFNETGFRLHAGNLEGLSVDSLGRILTWGGFYGQNYFPTGADYGTFTIVRYLEDGSVDPAYGNNGIARLLPTQETSHDFSDAHVLPDGALIAVTRSYGSTPPTAARFTEDGQLDSSFGEAGIARLPVSGSTGVSHFGSFVDTRGRIGFASSYFEVLQDFGTEFFRLHRNGTPDESFAPFGVFQTDLSPLSLDDQYIVGMFLDQSQSVVGYGWTYDRTTGKYDALVVRLDVQSACELTPATIRVSEPAAVVNLFEEFATPDTITALDFAIAFDDHPGLVTGFDIDRTNGAMQLHVAPNQQGTTRLTIRATSPDGVHLDRELLVTVLPPIGAPEAILAGPVSGTVGQSLAFQLFAEDDAEDTIRGFDYIVNWGDGTQAIPATEYSGLGLTVTHTYEAAGTYSVLLTATDFTGTTSSIASHVVEVVLDTPTQPEIDIRGNGVTIESGDITPTSVDFTDFGSVSTDGGTVRRQYRIENTGAGTLELTGTPLVTLSGPHGTDFTVSVQPSAIVTSGDSTTFEITFDPSATGVRTATVSIANTDTDEDSFTFNIQGVGTDTPTAFQLHSLLGASHTIYLDFDGHVTSGTDWNANYTGGQDFVTPAFDLDGDAATFSLDELDRIRDIWAQVAEDFMPFDVDVTTEEPGADALWKDSSDPNDQQWGIRVVIGGNGEWYSGSLLSGTTYIGSFNWSTDTPSFVFSDNMRGLSATYRDSRIANTISHEIGHSLGLLHDGTTGPQLHGLPPGEYYYGHATSMDPVGIDWNSIMGSQIGSPLTQWSRGEYSGATNVQDDLAIISTQNGFGYRSDDHGSSMATATAVQVSNPLNASAHGVIEQPADVDVFGFALGQATMVSLQARPAIESLTTSSGQVIYSNLDIEMTLLNLVGDVIGSSNPTNLLEASLTISLEAGVYYIRVDGVGKGDPGVDGYSDYGSLGAYSISVSSSGGELSSVLPDLQPPVVTAITRSTSSQTNTDIVIIDFSEDVAAVDISDFSLSRDGDILDMSGLTMSGGGAQWSIELASLGSVPGMYVLELSAAGSGIVDLAGNELIEDAAGSWRIDRAGTELTVNIVTLSLNSTFKQSTVTFQFSEDVTGFDASDLTVTGGTLSNFTVVDAQNYTAVFTADDGIETTGSVAVGDDYTNLSGIRGTAGSDTVAIDTLNPTVALNIVGGALNNGNRSSLVTFEFSEDVSGFDLNDVTAIEGTLSDFTVINAGSFTAVFTANVGVRATGTVLIGTEYTDLAGNRGLAGGDTVTIDTRDGNYPTLVKDINVQPNLGGASPNNFLEINGTTFFTAYAVTTGEELWKTDGTEAGTVLVKDIVGGPRGSSPQELTNVDGTLFFTIEAPYDRWELWKSDGTVAGTVRVIDTQFLDSGGLSTGHGLTNVDGTLYFIANDGLNGEEVWKSDGTAVGTAVLKDISPGFSGSYPSSLTTMNGSLYFAARDGVNGSELWKSDGTPSGTFVLKDIRSGASGSYPSYLTSAVGKLYFTANDGTTGQELWMTDGTDSGTVRVKDIRAGGGSSNPQQLTPLNDHVYFIANDGINGRELWKSDGTESGTAMIADIRAGSTSSYPSELTPINSVLFFTANDGVTGAEVWQTDGTTAGTSLVKDIRSGSNGSNPAQLTKLNGMLFFTANDGANGRELWKSDGTAAGTTLAKDIADGSSGSYPSSLATVNGSLFFQANDGIHGTELWRSDRTDAGTVLFKDLSNGNSGSHPNELVSLNAFSFFVASDGINGSELWKSDGTAAGTMLVKDIRSGSAGSYPQYLTSVNGTLFFRAYHEAHGWELWKSDGTETGTTLVKDIRVGSDGSGPRGLTEVNGTLYFTAFESLSGLELWRSDGTESGTFVVKDIAAGDGSAFPFNLTDVHGTLYFVAYDGSDGNDLWKSDGTETGTVMVKDILSGMSTPEHLTDVNGTLFFTLDDGIHGYELWKSDGTESGTVMVTDIQAGAGSSDPQSLTNVDGVLYFTTDDGINGRELWKSDGTETGTVLVKDILVGQYGSSPRDLTGANGTLFFVADDGIAGTELWRSDGTEDGTLLVKDIRAGIQSSDLIGLASVGGILYFRADDGIHGPELWRSDGTDGGTLLVDDIAIPGGSSPGNFTELNGVVIFTATTELFGQELFSLSLSASIRGIVWSDLDADGVRDDVEPKLAGVTVYADLNNNKQLDGNEPFAISQDDDPATEDADETGHYRLADIPSGTQVIRQITPDGYVQTLPETGLRAPIDPGFGADFQFTPWSRSLNGLAYSSVSQELFALSSDEIRVFTREGELLRLYSVNDSYEDLSVLPEAISLGGTNVPAGSLLASTRETFFALSPLDGSVIASVTASLTENFSISYDPNSNEILTHSLFGSDAVQRFDPFTGALTSSVVATEIEFGDVEFLAPTGGFISAKTASNNGYTVVTEFDASGSIIRTLDLTATFGIRPLSSQNRGGITGLAYDEVNDTLYLAGTDGLIYSVDGLFAADSTQGAWTVQLDASEVAEGIEFGNVPIIAPTDLHLSATSIAENQAIGTIVGTFLTDDNSPADHHRYLLVAGEGDTDNSSFAISGDALVTEEMFDFEQRSTYTIRVRSTDSLGQHIEKSIQIFVNNVNEPPTALILDDSRVFEQQPVGTPVGRFTAEDPETFDFFPIPGFSPFQFSLVDGIGDDDNPSFAIEGDILKTNTVFDSETRTSYSIRVQVVDPEGAAYQQSFAIVVDPIRGVPPLLDINAHPQSAGSNPVELVDVNGILYFVANEGMHGIELWKSDGSPTGTVMIKDIHPGLASSGLRYLTNLAGTLLFQADDGVHGQELWKSDGTTEGTVLVKDIHAGGGSGSPYNLTNVGGLLFFTARDGANGYELWRSDGTADGTFIIKDINPGPGSSYPRYLTSVNGTVFFRANDGTHGFELWKSDGTTDGTVLVHDIVLGSDSGWVPQAQPVSGNGLLYFLADDGIHGTELWKSDGTPAGTTIVADVQTGPQSSFPSSLITVNETLFFSADDGVHGRELWKSDGTMLGTQLVLDLHAGTAPSLSFYGEFVRVNELLYFSATDGVAAYELWRSDGTESGTILVADISQGGGGSYPMFLTAAGDFVYFAADDGIHGFELWKSDGTAAGTTLLLDATEDAIGSSPYLITRSGNHIYFAATTEIYGTELYTAPKADPIITWTKPADITFGALLGASQLNASASVAGTFVYSPAAGTQLSASANQQLSVTFTPTDTLNYNNAIASVLIDVLKADPIITWNAPSDVTFGTPLSNTQLNATANVAGTFAYSRAVGTQLNAGADQQLSVTFTPTDTLNYNNAVASVLIDVLKVDPIITWNAPSDITFGTPFSNTQLNATANVAGTFAYSRAVGTELNAGADQQLSVTFTPTDTLNYNNAVASVLIDVLKADPIITWAKPADITFGALLGASQLNASASIAGTFVYSPAAGTQLNASANQQLSVTFTPTDTLNYNNAVASVLIDVLKADPVITWNAPSDITFGTPLSNTQLDATANVAGTFAYTPAVGTQLNAGADQQLSVTFTPADTLNYNNAVASVTIGVVRLFDYGDAPSALQSGFKSDYPVTITNDGARHSESLLFLGSLIDTETDGQVSDLAGQDGVEGDDGIGVDDEDGVRFVTTLVAQGGVASTSSVVVTASGAGKLDAWIDFNRDGDWLDAGEQILSSIQVAKGDNTLTFSVPAGATAGRTFARFRLSSTGGLAPTGVADDGEVEDYLVELVNGDVVSGVDVVIASIGAEPIELVTEGNQVILRRGGTELFRASQASLRTIDVAGTDGDDTLDIADVSLIVSGKLTGNFGSGTDVLRLTGGNQTLSLAQIVEANIHGLDLIDITGIGANSLTLGSADVRAISEITKTLRVQHNSDDTVTYVGKWAAGLPELVAGQFLHVLTLGDTSVRVVNSAPFHNPLVASDTDRDGRTSPLDALIIINQLNATGPQALSQPSSVVNLTNFYYVDINHDGAIAPIDVLVIINVLNASIGIAEHEYAASPLLPSSFPSLMVTMTSQETKTRVAFDIPIGFATQPPASMATRNQPPVLASWRNSLQVAPSRQDLDELIDAVDAFFAELGSMIE